jgi:hypothetical protein
VRLCEGSTVGCDVTPAIGDSNVGSSVSVMVGLVVSIPVGVSSTVGSSVLVSVGVIEGFMVSILVGVSSTVGSSVSVSVGGRILGAGLGSMIVGASDGGAVSILVGLFGGTLGRILGAGLGMMDGEKVGLVVITTDGGALAERAVQTVES